MRESTEGGAAAAVAVVVIIVLAVLFYFYFLAPGPAEEPAAKLSKAKPIGDGNWIVVIDSVQPSRSLYHYRATMHRGDSYEVTLEPLTETSNKIVFVDLDGDWQLSDNDYFVLKCEEGGSYSFEVVHTPDGKILGTVAWEAGM